MSVVSVLDLQWSKLRPALSKFAGYVWQVSERYGREQVTVEDKL